MPITFGAVGDIISVCLLVKDLVEALDKARGSKAEYQSAIRELWLLDRALLEIDLLSRAHSDGATPELHGLCATAKQAVIRCKGLVSDFLHRVRRYQKVFVEGGKPNVLHEAATKLRWRIGEKDALDQFRVEIAGTSSSLQMLLATASVTLLEISRKEINNKLDQADEQHNLTNSSQQALLCNIQGRIEDANRGIDANNSILGKVTDALRFDWLRQLGGELRGLLHRSIAINVATYQAVISNQASLPSRLERGLIEEPVILEDALGRIAPVHLQFVTSWDAFDAILEIRFRGFQGHKKIAQGHYGLQDRVTGKEVEQSRAWQRAFLPGQRVEMSMVFHHNEPMNSDPGNVTCPGCHTPATNGSDADVHCVRCLMWYRRITVIEEEGSSKTMPQAQPQEIDQAFRGTNKPLESRKRKGAPQNLGFDSDEEDVRGFKRVRILSTLRRDKYNRPFDTTGQICPAGLVPRVTATLWEDEGSLCFQVEKNGVCIPRREDNHCVNGTRLLDAAGVVQPYRDEILQAEKTHYVVLIGPRHLRGVWIPFERALYFANKERMTEDLYPLFVHNIAALLYHPSNQPRRSTKSHVVNYGLNKGEDSDDSLPPPRNGPHQSSIHPSIDASMAAQTGQQDGSSSPDTPTPSLHLRYSTELTE